MYNYRSLKILYIFLALKLLLHVVTNAGWSFHRDELLYLALGQHLSWGYASVPPGIGFWAWIGEFLLGGSVGAIRMMSTFLGLAVVFITGLMTLDLLPKDASPRVRDFALALVGLAGILSGAWLRTSMLFMPVIFDLFYWTWLSWLLLRYLKTEQQNYLLYIGVVTGLGLLNKYSVLIFLFALLPGLLLSKHRQLFKTRALYLAGGAAILIWSPNLLWQAQHDFPVFQHMRELAATQFVHVTRTGFLGDQMIFFMPFLPVWLAGLYYLLFRPEAKLWRPLGWMYLMVMAILVFFNAKSYYSLGAYSVLLAAGAAFIATQTAMRWLWLRYALIVFVLAFGFISIPAALPLLPPEQETRLIQKLTKLPGLENILRWENGRNYALPQDFADMLGWQELGEEVGRQWAKLPEPGRAAIYAESYGQAGAITHFGRPWRLPQVWSFNESFKYWFPDSLPADFQTLIYVNDELGDDMPGFFNTIEKVWELNMPLSRQHGNQIYVCHGPSPAFFARINQAVQQIKRNELPDN